MKKFSVHSITIRYFIVAALSIILPICIFFQIAQKINLNTSLAQKKESDLATLNTFSGNITTYLESVQAVGSLIASDLAVKEFLASSRSKSEQQGKIIYKSMDNQAYLQPYTQALDGIAALSLMDPDFFFVGEQTLDLNRLTYFFNDTTKQELTASSLPYHWTKTFSIEILKNKQVYKVFSLLVPSLDKDGHTLGYVALFVEASFFNKLLQTYHDKIYVVEGTSIIGSKDNLPVPTNLFTKMKISYSLLLEDSSVILPTSDDSLVITTRFFPELDVHLLLVSSYQDFIRELPYSFPSLITFTIYGIFLAVLISMVITRLQTKHILALKNVMNRMKKGNLSIRFQPKSRDEIAELGITFNSLLDRIQELMEEQKQNQKAKRKMELQMIQEQVKPHFLYNVLEMISSMIRCDMNQEALISIENLSSFYRISLNKGSPVISISQEVRLLENYLSLQKKRYIEFMDYVLAFSPDISGYTIPKLTLQPLIENSIYHGIKEKDSKGTICVSGYLSEGRVVIEVYDNGIGISEEKQKEILRSIHSDAMNPDNHFGVASVVKRLNIYYNNQVTFQIDSKLSEYTCMILSFPAQEYIKNY